jgi:hypothetical protein
MGICLKKWLCRNPFFSDYPKITHRMEEGTVPVPPYRPCAYSDDDVLPVLGLSHSGEQKQRGINRRISEDRLEKIFIRKYTANCE